MIPTPPDPCRLRITLKDIEPAIWRLIEVPATASCWDVHVAIQDAMGWQDAHLHAFRPRAGTAANLGPVGMPVDGRPDIRPGWEVPFADLLAEVGEACDYEYDFGDGWVHAVERVAVEDELRAPLPRCLDGARACPPENCGGPPGYAELLEILTDPAHPAHEERVAWLAEFHEDDDPFDPEAFDPAAVHFTDPNTRLADLHSGY